MRVNFSYIKVFVLVLLVVFLFAFSTHRNSNRKVVQPIIKFIGESQPFITHEAVSKLLIQNQQTVTGKPKDIIDLSQLEAALNSSPMIKSAQVHMSVDGVLTAEIEQKRPIARVRTNMSYYIDDEGSFMPLSANYTARVPLVTGNIEKNNLTSIYNIAKKINEDEFLKIHITSINQNSDNTLDLYVRDNNFKVQLGSLKQLDKKINNLKAFYKKAIKDKTIDSYRVVNLKFDSQVICTKK
ncbi:cell division protein FtsQ/DivIB [Ichthyenterobacterium sp. W332]|uniref:Cell division protein FtsQ/DivIB n=1 Tax=Microcosmobacter mediterraneus TaxID=3075607 RepID=A0ABU2YKW5_9FLAO|nr:cell division protein FtsQ/DivIB [Ichthyenterobacterium sp. W332]MDT0558465.1 cell division protein FtsQ/DivIB [Ichthyenterobacterium sp. W332]